MLRADGEKFSVKHTLTLSDFRQQSVSSPSPLV
jgi:hypothetical protein